MLLVLILPNLIHLISHSSCGSNWKYYPNPIKHIQHIYSLFFLPTYQFLQLQPIDKHESNGKKDSIFQSHYVIQVGPEGIVTVCKIQEFNLLGYINMILVHKIDTKHLWKLWIPKTIIIEIHLYQPPYLLSSFLIT